MDKLFTTKSCTQCQALKPHLEANNIELEVIDAEDHAYLASEYEVMNVPTIVTEGGERYIGGGKCMQYVMERKGDA